LEERCLLRLRSRHLSAEALLGLRVSAIALGERLQFEEDDDDEMNILAKEQDSEGQ
jgi:hypothetical protein